MKKPSGTAKAKRTAEELLALIRRDLDGKYANVSITIERFRSSWIAVPNVESEVMRSRVEKVVRRIRKFNDLA